ncbi:hypothetical protein SNQ55_004301 [Cronobacter sakazakii]|uniref:hypothetical protein n=1 Tax=Cronobacter sakazakii TaxID=28141 RepID=UPI000CF0BE50|nr:hypothetical protein [Cronobacter sakazakii]ELY6363783.1 hypothetical protein [Cronobacter sakazakii]PPY51175.1 hypothetical protein C3D79_07280 [Cronobacter sakazakii]PQY49555.1 hypothetical protein C5959_05250 [Cronobacter sakazakii]HCC0172528.1 hypothetical protein [Cronobacter sakazakii]HCC0190481.1 hypothetical protein [Cronobacter sakazakii]
MDKSREQFEAEISKKFGDLIDQRVCKNSDGDYMAWDMQVAWWAWQASRAAVEIELPPKFGERQQQLEGNGWNWMRSHSVNAIRAAGLKVKGE